jgi:DNA polymerase-3 subunit gamma/tau
MASTALYLKWRPQQFQDVVGQEHVTQTLQNALRGGRIAHAYLFTGPRGTGKTTMARLLAKAVNCLDEDVAARPCNRCRICQAINEGRLLDLIEMDAASHTGVDNVREAIRDKVGFRPSEARYKVYVIDEVHMLSTSAFNALLKTLEEPPEHVIFCLATTEPHRILPTIVSRCQRFDFRRIPRSAMVARLRFIAEQEGIQIDDEALGFIAQSATGSARDAISLLDQLTAYGDEQITVQRLRSVLGLSDIELVYQLASSMAAHEVGRGLDVINQAVAQGADVRQFVQQVIEYLRAALLVHVGGSDASIEMDARTRTELDSLVRHCSAHELLRAVQLFNQAQLDLRGHDQGQLALELAFVEAALAPERPSPAVGPGSHAAPAAAPAADTGIGAHPTAANEHATPARMTPAETAARSESRAEPSAADGDADASLGAQPAPPRTPPRAPPRVSEPIVAQEKEPEPEPGSETVSPEYIARMRGDVSAALRAEGPAGRKADGLFGTVFHIGEIKVLDGSELLFGLPRGVFAQVTGDVDQVLERVLGAVLGQSVRARFVDKARLAEYRSSQAAPKSVPESVESVQAPGADPIEDAKSDPVVQDLIRRGGQVTDVEAIE